MTLALARIHCTAEQLMINAIRECGVCIELYLYNATISVKRGALSYMSTEHTV